MAFHLPLVARAPGGCLVIDTMLSAMATKLTVSSLWKTAQKGSEEGRRKDKTKASSSLKENEKPASSVAESKSVVL